MPSGSAGEALRSRHAPRHGRRCRCRWAATAPRGAHARHRRCAAWRRSRPSVLEPRARAVEQPESQDDAASAGVGEALSLLLGGERGAQDRQYLPDRRVLGTGPSGQGRTKRDGGLNVDLRAGRDSRVDENPRSVRAEPIVLAPRVRIEILLRASRSGSLGAGRRRRRARRRQPRRGRRGRSPRAWASRTHGPRPRRGAAARGRARRFPR